MSAAVRPQYELVLVQELPPDPRLSTKSWTGCAVWEVTQTSAPSPAAAAPAHGSGSDAATPHKARTSTLTAGATVLHPACCLPGTTWRAAA